MIPAQLRLLLVSLLPVLSVAIQCGPVGDLSSTYLSGLKHHSENGEVSNFIPSAYYGDIATSKYVTTRPDVRSIFDDYLCVDGGTTATPIQLYDDGRFGDDVAGDGIYTRACVHFCEWVVNYADIYGFAWEQDLLEARLVAVSPTQRGQIPHRILPNALYPQATLVATSHAAFFVDHQRVYMPDWPESRGVNGDAPGGHSAAVSSVLEVFGDVFDYVTLTSYESNTAFQGDGIYKWQNWVHTGGPTPDEAVGDIDQICAAAMTGLPNTRLTGVITSRDTISDNSGLVHELIHGVSGYEYNRRLSKARTGDGHHVPGSCTLDHSQLQGPLWDWERGPGYFVAFDYCTPGQECRPQPNDYVRVLPNDDCASCPDGQLTSCCSFRYEYAYGRADHIAANPEINNMSPLMQYIAGFISYDDMMALPQTDRNYYCLGSDTDGGCGSGNFPCVGTVNDNDPSNVRSSYVERFTFEELVAANGGRRDPTRRSVNDIRHVSIMVGQRMPNEAELTFYTLFWRHQEVQNVPYGRDQSLGYRSPIYNWYSTSGGKSRLHSRLHGVPCGGGLQAQSCVDTSSACDASNCGANAQCVLLDNRPLCICNSGFLGDGTTCVTPEETLSYPLPSAYSTRPICFGTVWTDYVTESQLPPYPGGYDPFRAVPCSPNCFAPSVPPELVVADGVVVGDGGGTGGGGGGNNGNDGLQCGELFCFSGKG